MIKIPITMCHGIDPQNPDPWLNLSKEHFEDLVRTASEMGFESINYDDLASWRQGDGVLPDRPIMFRSSHEVDEL